LQHVLADADMITSTITAQPAACPSSVASRHGGRPRSNRSGTTTHCRIAGNRHERLAAFRLIYQQYTRVGLIDSNPFELRVTNFHLLPTTNVFLAYVGDELVGTVSLIGDGELGLPMDITNPDVVDDLRRQGRSLGEVSCLALRPMPHTQSLAVFVEMTRLMAQHARVALMDDFLIASVPKHERFYERFMGCRRVGEPMPYPLVNETVGVACRLDLAAVDEDRPPCHERYFSEWLPAEQLRPSPMPPEDVDYFEAAAQASGASVAFLGAGAW
jgi:hypothetical protein